MVPADTPTAPGAWDTLHTPAVHADVTRQALGIRDTPPVSTARQTPCAHDVLTTSTRAATTTAPADTRVDVVCRRSQDMLSAYADTTATLVNSAAARPHTITTNQILGHRRRTHSVFPCVTDNHSDLPVGSPPDNCLPRVDSVCEDLTLRPTDVSGPPQIVRSLSASDLPLGAVPLRGNPLTRTHTASSLLGTTAIQQRRQTAIRNSNVGGLLGNSHDYVPVTQLRNLSVVPEVNSESQLVNAMTVDDYLSDVLLPGLPPPPLVLWCLVGHVLCQSVTATAGPAVVPVAATSVVGQPGLDPSSMLVGTDVSATTVTAHAVSATPSV